MNWIDSKEAEIIAWALLLVFVIYIGIHFILAYPKLINAEVYDSKTNESMELEMSNR